jgi:hypothetical protein
MKMPNQLNSSVYEELESIEAIYGDSLTWISNGKPPRQMLLLDDTDSSIAFSLPLWTSCIDDSIHPPMPNNVVGDLEVRYERCYEIYKPTYRVLSRGVCIDLSEIEQAVEQAVLDLTGEDEHGDAVMSVFVAYQAALDKLHEIMKRRANMISKSIPADDCPQQQGRAVPIEDGPLPSMSSYWVVIEIDHMRDSKQYTKTMRQWMKQLDLCGSLFHCNSMTTSTTCSDSTASTMWKGIYLVLIGKNDKGSCDEFQKRLRSQSIDIDSKGRPCKERVASVLFQRSYDEEGQCPSQVLTRRSEDILKIYEYSKVSSKEKERNGKKDSMTLTLMDRIRQEYSSLNPKFVEEFISFI